jgi:hypothetical protein
MTDIRRAIAVHEGGHAVVARALGLTVASLWIDEGGEGGGASISDATHLPLVARVATLRAGHQAILLLDIDAPSYLSARDQQIVASLLGDLSEDEQTRLLGAGRDSAMSLLVRHRVAVEAVADRLEATGAMDAATFDAIFVSDLPNLEMLDAALDRGNSEVDAIDREISALLAEPPPSVYDIAEQELRNSRFNELTVRKVDALRRLGASQEAIFGAKWSGPRQ